MKRIDAVDGALGAAWDGTATVCRAGPLLLTVAAGRRLATTIVRALAEARPNGVVIADLRAVRHAGYRALHELLSAVAMAHAEYDGRYLVVSLERNNEELIAALEAAANQRGIALPLVLYPDRGTRLLGKLTRSERETLDLVVRAGKLTAAALRRQAQLRTPSASNRLRRLYRLRLVRREERIVAGNGGREFIYEAVVPGTSLP